MKYSLSIGYVYPRDSKEWPYVYLERLDTINHVLIATKLFPISLYQWPLRNLLGIYKSYFGIACDPETKAFKERTQFTFTYKFTILTVSQYVFWIRINTKEWKTKN